MMVQNGYGFVHYPLSPEGIESALAAVNSLHQITINQITFDCSVSNQLKQILARNSMDNNNSNGNNRNRNNNNRRMNNNNMNNQQQQENQRFQYVPPPIRGNNPRNNNNNMNSNNNNAGQFATPSYTPYAQPFPHQGYPQQQQQMRSHQQRSSYGVMQAPMGTPPMNYNSPREFHPQHHLGAASAEDFRGGNHATLTNTTLNRFENENNEFAYHRNSADSYLLSQQPQGGFERDENESRPSPLDRQRLLLQQQQNSFSTSGSSPRAELDYYTVTRPQGGGVESLSTYDSYPSPHSRPKTTTTEEFGEFGSESYRDSPHSVKARNNTEEFGEFGEFGESYPPAHAQTRNNTEEFGEFEQSSDAQNLF
jgi:hypothetical protein